MTIYEITCLIKHCLQLESLCKLSVPSGSSPSGDKARNLQSFTGTIVGEVYNLMSLRLGLIFDGV